MTTKIDLDELTQSLAASPDARATREESIALVTRIRELETAVRSCATGGLTPNGASQHSIEGERYLYALLEKGAIPIQSAVSQDVIVPGATRAGAPCSTCGKPGCRPMAHAGWHPDDEGRG